MFPIATTGILREYQRCLRIKRKYTKIVNAAPEINSLEARNEIHSMNCVIRGLAILFVKAKALASRSCSFSINTSPTTIEKISRDPRNTIQIKIISTEKSAIKARTLFNIFRCIPIQQALDLLCLIKG